MTHLGHSIKEANPSSRGKFQHTPGKRGPVDGVERRRLVVQGYKTAAKGTVTKRKLENAAESPVLKKRRYIRQEYANPLLYVPAATVNKRALGNDQSPHASRDKYLIGLNLRKYENLRFIGNENKGENDPVTSKQKSDGTERRVGNKKSTLPQTKRKSLTKEAPDDAVGTRGDSKAIDWSVRFNLKRICDYVECMERLLSCVVLTQINCSRKEAEMREYYNAMSFVYGRLVTWKTEWDIVTGSTDNQKQAVVRTRANEAANTFKGEDMSLQWRIGHVLPLAKNAIAVIAEFLAMARREHPGEV